MYHIFLDSSKYLPPLSFRKAVSMGHLIAMKDFIAIAIIGLAAWLGYLAGLNTTGLTILLLIVVLVEQLVLRSVRKRWRRNSHSQDRL